MKLIFTYHAEQRMRQRKITKLQIMEAVMYPDITIKKHGKYFYLKRAETGDIEVVCERTAKNIKIVTVYWV